MITYIPAELVALLTFPGVILHEISHRFFCDLFHVRVYHVNYFAASKNAGHVIFEPQDIKHDYQTFLISYAPLIINSVIGGILIIPSTINMFNHYTAHELFIVSFITKWIGATCLFNAFPSIRYLDNVIQASLPIWLGIIHRMFYIGAFILNTPFIGGLLRILCAYQIANLFAFIFCKIFHILIIT